MIWGRRCAAWLLLGALAVLAGCAAMDKPVPEDYSGPVVRLFDSMQHRSATSVDFFYVAKVNGRRIPNSVTETRSVNYGRGFSMSPIVMSRDVPAEPTTFKIVGRTEHAAPILALLNKVYEISGDTTFTPLPDRRYRVTGNMNDEHSAVWIEDTTTNEVMGTKIEVGGKSTLGILQK